MVPSEACFEPTRYADQQQREALEEVHRQFWLSEESLHGVIDCFQKELKAGLVDDRSSDLNMIPSFVSGRLLGVCGCVACMNVHVLMEICGKLIRLSYWAREGDLFGT